MTSPIPFQDIRVLSFDIYGTLIDWETGIHKNLQDSPLGPYLPTSRQQVLQEFEQLERTIHRETPTKRQALLNAEVVRRYAKQLNVIPSKLSEAEVDAAAIEFGDGIGSWSAFPDTVAAIQKLQSRYKLVPLSNIDRESFDRTLKGPLKGCRFDAVYTAEDIGSYKPDPRNFEYLLKHVKSDFGVEKEGLCHVAQSLFHDHVPAREFGITSVWVNRKGFMGTTPNSSEGQGKVGGEEYGFKLEVHSLGELAEIVGKAIADA